MCEKCEIMKAGGAELARREVGIVLTVAQLAALLTVIDLADQMNIDDEDLYACRERIFSTIAADKVLFQNGEWPDEITEVEQ